MYGHSFCGSGPYVCTRKTIGSKRVSCAEKHSKAEECKAHDLRLFLPVECAFMCSRSRFHVGFLPVIGFDHKEVAFLVVPDIARVTSVGMLEAWWNLNAHVPVHLFCIIVYPGLLGKEAVRLYEHRFKIHRAGCATNYITGWCEIHKQPEK